MLPLHLQPESHIPLYVQLRDQLRALVHCGELRTGDRIPASRELAGQLGVHRTTVANAYAELESEGLIQGHVGRGTFICRRARNNSRRRLANNGNGGAMRWESLFADERGEDGLSRLMPDIPAGRHCLYHARARRGIFPGRRIPALLQCGAAQRRPRSSATGLDRRLRAAQARADRDCFRAKGCSVRDEQLLITDGCQQAIDLLCKAFLRPGDAVALENPAYPGAVRIFCRRAHAHAGRAGARPMRQRTGTRARHRRPRSGADAEPREIHLPHAGFSQSYRHGPAGAERRRLLEIAAHYQVPVIEDTIYARLRLRGSRDAVAEVDGPFRQRHPDRQFFEDRFPRAARRLVHRPGKRDRAAAAGEAIHRSAYRSACASRAGGIHAAGPSDAVTSAMSKVYRQRLDALEVALEEVHARSDLRWTQPEGGMSVWLTLPPGFDAGELLIHVRERGVLFVPGRYFYSQHPQPNTLRLGFATIDEKNIARGIHILGDTAEDELRKRHRGARVELHALVALV